MCRAFSCIVTPKEVHWRFGMDSHTNLLHHYHIPDNTADPALMAFARVEIAPANGSYLEPDGWVFAIDQTITPAWFGEKHKALAWEAHKKWLRRLDKILVHKPIVHPLKVKPPAKITKKHLALLAVWASVWDSIWASVGDSVRASVWDSVRASVGDSVGASVWAYTGSFFLLPRKSWLYTDKVKIKGYPFRSCVALGGMGLVPSFDGKLWRLHGGSKATVLWQGVIENGVAVAK